MKKRSDIQGYIAERTKGQKDWPSERYLIVRYASRVAAQLEHLRLEQGFSYEELARRAETSKAHVIRLLGGTYDGMTSKSMLKVARALGVVPETTFQPIADLRAAAHAKARDGERRRVAYV